MTGVVCAGVMVAAALWIWPSPAWWLRRIDVAGVPPVAEQDPERTGPDDPFAIAAAFDLFAVCLRAGLPTGTAAEIVARVAPARLAVPLARTAELLHLGADPDRAWAAANSDDAPAMVDEHFDAMAVMARRSARAGSSMASGLAELADTTRDGAHDAALAAAERAGVAISGPLGLCFLPAFVCLGIVPVVIGLAGSVLGGV
ncbi:type II secretion system F family protein [Gordonia soli]|uniref:Type II secretion system protein GspF domain-containing protein n=1 Tax=Gordonia soli NBRC 108243 TaxID=1223545 RepID=M0QH16_9ACTN|nr:type II secretion system F family protein [Gordonia soli]GAC67606.1 hypothetical protein GS4_08_01910 [Gordonia soli NBRC 108243]